MNKDTADLLHETLAAIDKHTSRLNSLDKKSRESTDKLSLVAKELEVQIQASTKDVLLQLVEKGNTDKEQLVKDITSAIAASIANLTVNAGNISITVETDPIAKAISKLPINNTNNVVVDTSELTKDNKQFLNAFQNLNGNLSDNLVAMKLVFQEMIKRDKVESVKETKEVKPIKVNPPITKMIVKRDKDNLIESVEFS